MKVLVTLTALLSVLPLHAQQVRSAWEQIRVVAAGDFDVLADGRDANGFVLNPYWRWQAKPGNQGLVPDPNQLCSNGLPDSADCSSQATWENLPGIPKVFICMWNLQASLIGHINWMPATYTGGLLWEAKTTDQDCNFRTKPEGNLGLTQGSVTFAGGMLGLEFDSRETIQQMHTSPWADLWQRISDGTPSEEVNTWLQGHTGGTPPYAVLVGQFGVDCEHDCHTELHPVYGVAVQLDPRPTDNVWGIMVRNWGNEGFCAQGQVELSLPGNEFKLFLPHQGTAKPVVTSATRFYANSLLPPPRIDYVNATDVPGVLVTFTLPDPSDKALAELELHLSWTDGLPGPRTSPVAQRELMRTEPPGMVESYLDRTLPGPGAGRSRITRFQDPAVQSRLALFQAAAARPTQLVALPVPYPVGEISAVPVMRAVGRAAATAPAFDPVEQAQDEALFEALCAAYKNKPPHIPSGACKAWRSRRARLQQPRDGSPK